MKNSHYFSFTLLLTLLINNLSAQDVLHKKNGQSLEVKIEEIASDEVKYRLFNNLEGPLYSLDKIDVQKIVFENGHTEYYTDNFSNSDLYTHQKRQNIKIGFLSPLVGHTSLTYERNLKPGRGFEIKGSIIGLGINNSERKPRGAFFSAGYKFYRTPDYYLKGMRYAHILKGAYIKPEFILGNYSETVGELILPNNRNDFRRNITFGAIMVNFGKQWVYADVLTIDIYAGAGYGFDHISRKDDLFFDDIASHHFAVTKFGSGTNFAGALGFNIGFLF